MIDEIANVKALEERFSRFRKFSIQIDAAVGLMMDTIKGTPQAYCKVFWNNKPKGQTGAITRDGKFENAIFDFVFPTNVSSSELRVELWNKGTGMFSKEAMLCVTRVSGDELFMLELHEECTLHK